MLRLTFSAALGQDAVQTRAKGFRLCADSTLRGNDNSLAATRINGFWFIGQRLFRQFECDGPVLLIVRKNVSDPPIPLGPFDRIRAGAALIWGDEELLWARVPGWSAGRDSIHEVSLIDVMPTRPGGTPR